MDGAFGSRSWFLHVLYYSTILFLEFIPVGEVGLGTTMPSNAIYLNHMCDPALHSRPDLSCANPFGILLYVTDYSCSSPFLQGFPHPKVS
jgi:hypothetical protein